MPRIELRGPEELNVKDEKIFLLTVKDKVYFLTDDEIKHLWNILKKYLNCISKETKQ